MKDSKDLQMLIAISLAVLVSFALGFLVSAAYSSSKILTELNK